MAKQKHVVGQPVGFFLGQASRPPMGSGPMMSNPAPFSNPGGVGPFFSGGTPFQGVRPPFQGGGFFQGGPGGMPPMSPPGGSGGLGGLIQGLLGGNGGFNLPSILSNAQKMIGAVNQAGEVFRNVGPMLQLLKGFDLNELLQADDAEVLTEVDDDTQKKKKRKKRKSKAGKRKKSTKRIRNKVKSYSQ